MQMCHLFVFIGICYVQWIFLPIKPCFGFAIPYAIVLFFMHFFFFETNCTIKTKNEIHHKLFIHKPYKDTTPKSFYQPFGLPPVLVLPPPPPSVTQVSLFKVVCEVREYEMCRDCGEFFCLHWYRFYRALAIVMLRDVQYTLLTKLASTAPSHPSQNYTKAPLKYWEPKNKFMINFQ